MTEDDQKSGELKDVQKENLKFKTLPSDQKEKLVKLKLEEIDNLKNRRISDNTFFMLAISISFIYLFTAKPSNEFVVCSLILSLFIFVICIVWLSTIIKCRQDTKGIYEDIREKTKEEETLKYMYQFVYVDNKDEKPKTPIIKIIEDGLLNLPVGDHFLAVVFIIIAIISVIILCLQGLTIKHCIAAFI